MHCNLRQPDAEPVTFRFDWDARAKFEVDQPISCCFIAILLLIHYVMLWPWPLTPWAWTRVVDLTSCDQTLYKIRAKWNNPRLSYWRRKYFRGANFQIQRVMDQTETNLGKRATLLLRQRRYFGSRRTEYQLSSDEGLWKRPKRQGFYEFCDCAIWIC